MTFKDQLISDIEKVFFNPLEFGEEAIYKPMPTGSTFEIVIIPSFQEDLASVMSGISSGQYKTGFFGLRADQVTPKVLDKVTYKDIDWTIRSIEGFDGLMYRVKVTTAERATL